MVLTLLTSLPGPTYALVQRNLGSMPLNGSFVRLRVSQNSPPLPPPGGCSSAGGGGGGLDTNLFPGGWNNLTEEMLPLAVQAAMAAIEKICPEAKNLLLIPERHTRNTFYPHHVPHH